MTDQTSEQEVAEMFLTEARKSQEKEIPPERVAAIYRALAVQLTERVRKLENSDSQCDGCSDSFDNATDAYCDKCYAKLLVKIDEQQDEIERWGNRLDFVHKEYGTDGSGCDSGDEIDVIESEIRQAINNETNRADELQSRLKAVSELCEEMLECMRKDVQEFGASEHFGDVKLASFRTRLKQAKGGKC